MTRQLYTREMEPFRPVIDTNFLGYERESWSMETTYRIVADGWVQVVFHARNQYQAFVMLDGREIYTYVNNQADYVNDVFMFPVTANQTVRVEKGASGGDALIHQVTYIKGI